MDNIASSLAICVIAICVTIGYIYKLKYSQFDDVADEIEKLSKLKENGHLTEEEFIKRKKKLLDT